MTDYYDHGPCPAHRMDPTEPERLQAEIDRLQAELVRERTAIDAVKVHVANVNDQLRSERDAARAVLRSHRYTMREGALVCVECREDDCKPGCALAAALEDK